MSALDPAPSAPVRFSPIFTSGRTGFEYGHGAAFESCDDVLASGLMQPTVDGYGRQAGVAFRLRNDQLVIARPGGRALRLARAV